MAKHAKPPPHEAAHVESAKPPSVERRRWLKAGLSASPVLMTVASRPVLAQTCVPPSAYVSLGASAPGMYGECLGYRPQAWLNENQWPDPYSRSSSRFNESFVTKLNVDPPNHPGPKLSEILGNELIADVNLSDAQRDVARYVTAALLNSAEPRKVPETVLRAMTIQHIWTEFMTTGFFVPTSGARWSAAEIVDYLKSTMPSF